MWALRTPASDASTSLTTQMVQEGTQLLSLAALLPEVIELAANNTYGESRIIALTVMSRLGPSGDVSGSGLERRFRTPVMCWRYPLRGAPNSWSRRSPGGVPGNVCLLLSSARLCPHKSRSA